MPFSLQGSVVFGVPQVWDDRSLLNVDFTIICTTYTVRDINMIEKKFLELLGYNVSVTASMYASYYFELRTLCEKKERAFTLKPLTEDARRRRALPHPFCIHTRPHVEHSWGVQQCARAQTRVDVLTRK
eukprot:6214563-Pleurochrysis_carterae.AAC.2